MNLEKLEKIKSSSVLIFGDVMIDKYIQGDVNRISPEAPVPILEVKSKVSKLGGAGNVINNIMALGGKAKMIGCIGCDSDGIWITVELKNKGVDTKHIGQYKEVKTISKTRLVCKNQQFLRYDEEEIRDIPDEYQKYVEQNVEDIFDSVNVVIISDYGKGTVTESLCQFIILQAKIKGIPVVVDPKGKNYLKYSGATICTPNVNELSVVSGKKLKNEDDLIAAGKQVLKDVRLDYLMLTRSEKGISLFSEETDTKKDFPALCKDVVDVTGAGDTVVSTVASLYSVGFTIEDCCCLANFAASIVCSKFGAATFTLDELTETIAKSGEFKLVDINTAEFICARLKEKNKKIVFTNGCFDLLHAGHLSSFLQAKSLGDVLVVAVNSDASVKRIKGDMRPVISQDDRIKMICGLKCVDYVVLMEESTPVNIIKTLKPDVCVKGRDWENKFIPELQEIEEYGGELKFIDLSAGLSTTAIIEKIEKAYGK